jgi:serine/threonine-protein kinase OSR1/STK39
VFGQKLKTEMSTIQNTEASDTTNTAQPSLSEWQADASRYQLLEKIGQGAFATVWKATHIASPDLLVRPSEEDTSNTAAVAAGITSTTVVECAVKVLNLDATDTTNLADIRHECQAMRLLSHPNILTCLAAFVHERSLWLVTPLMRKGSSLHSLTTARRQRHKWSRQQQPHPSLPGVPSDLPPLNLEQHIVYILHETLLGLQYIHDNDHIHRDIKGANILVDDTGHIKVSDFGVSGCLVPSRQARTFVGSPAWMAPVRVCSEKAYGVLNSSTDTDSAHIYAFPSGTISALQEVMEQVHGYDFKADIWSLGITALELAKGYAPYAKYPPMKVLIMTIQEAPPSLASYAIETGDESDELDGSDQSDVLDHFSPDFEALAALCLQKNPARRPSCSELLAGPYFAEYTQPETRNMRREALRDQVCALVKDVGGLMDATTTPMAASSLTNMPGNAPVSIVWAQAEDRPAGTTWVFADGSQVLSSSSTRHGAHDYDDDGVDDVLVALDEFERRTGGEHYDRNVAPLQPLELSEDATATAGASNARSAAAMSLSAPPSHSHAPPPEELPNEDGQFAVDELDQFMDEFEQSTAGENFRRDPSHE